MSGMPRLTAEACAEDSLLTEESAMEESAHPKPTPLADRNPSSLTAQASLPLQHALRPPPLPLQRPPYCPSNVVHNHAWFEVSLERLFPSSLRTPYSRPDQHTLPSCPILTRVAISSSNVALWIIAYHIHCGQPRRFALEPLPLQDPLPMPSQHPLRISISLAVGLSNHASLQLHAGRDAVPHARHGRLEGPLSEARQVEARAPEQVRIAEEQRRLVILLPSGVGERRVAIARREGAEVAGLGQQQVCDELDIQCPVARVIEDEHGIDLERRPGREAVYTHTRTEDRRR